MEKWKCLVLFLFLVPLSTHCYTSLNYWEAHRENAFLSKLITELDDILPKIAQEHASLYAGHQACSESLNQLKEKNYLTDEYGFSLLRKIRNMYRDLVSDIYVPVCVDPSRIHPRMPLAPLKPNNNVNNISLGPPPQWMPNGYIPPIPKPTNRPPTAPKLTNRPPTAPNPIPFPPTAPNPNNLPPSAPNPIYFPPSAPNPIAFPPSAPNPIDFPPTSSNPIPFPPPLNPGQSPVISPGPIGQPRPSECKCYQWPGYPGCYFPTQCTQPRPEYQWHPLPYHPWGNWYPSHPPPPYPHPGQPPPPFPYPI